MSACICYSQEPITTAAAASAISPWALAGASALGAGITSAFNWFSARKAESFSERMANTAHQREVEDLRKAGLNPILSAGGKGASAPAGIAAQGGNLDLVQSAMANAQIKKTNNEADLIAVERDRARDDWAIDAAMGPERLMSRRAALTQVANSNLLTEAQQKQVEAQIKLLDAQIPLTQAQARSAAAEAAKQDVLKKPYQYLDQILDYLPQSAKGLYNSVKGAPQRGLKYINQYNEERTRGR